MSAKISAARAAAFLKAVGETGNQTLAAERAKVSRSWVLLHRGRDPGFDAAVKAAVEEARGRLQGFSTSLEASGVGSGVTPPAKWRYMNGHQMVVRGTGDGIGGNRRVQVARARLKGWDPRTEDRFLEALAGTCNVRAACAAVGLSVASAYTHRYRWPAFARRWDETVTIASERIETGLLRAAIALHETDAVPVDVPIAGMTADHALNLLRHFVGTRAPRPGRRTGRPVEVASMEQTCRTLERALQKHWRQEARRAARDARRGGDSADR
jgi:hypothetical protein